MTPSTPDPLFDRLFSGDDPRLAAELARALDRDGHDEALAQLHDMASADAFVAAVEAKRDTAPWDLVASASRPRRAPMWKWSGMALAMAAAVMAAFIILNRQPLPASPTAPVTAQTAAPAPTTLAEPAKPAPSMLPAVGGYTMPTAGKKAPAPAMAPAASMETVPPARR